MKIKLGFSTGINVSKLGRATGGGVAATYSISGTVYDADGATAVSGATVTLGAASTTSAVNGTYTISGVAAGASGSMTCTKSGYSWTAITVSAMSGNLTGQNFTANLSTVPWIAQWKFNTDGNDSIGTNHLTGVNTPTFVGGKISNATQLTAASQQRWNVADNAALSTGDIDFTIGAWVYADTLATDRTIAGKFASGGAREYILLYNVSDHSPTTARFSFMVSADGTAYTSVDATSLGAVSLSTWYLVVAWHDSVANTINIQVNNGTVDSVSYSAGCADRGSAFNIGTLNATTWLWNGRIDNCFFAKSAAGAGGVLSAAQRTALYNSGNGTENFLT